MRLWERQSRFVREQKLNDLNHSAGSEAYRIDTFNASTVMNLQAKLRNQAFDQQNGRCYYCFQPMWRDDLERFMSKFRIGKRARRKAFSLRATAEHLVPKSDGGRDNAANIVAACHFCNLTRHRALSALAPHLYRQRARSRVAKGKWHGFQLERAIV